MAATILRTTGLRVLSGTCRLGAARVAVVGCGHQIQVATLKATYGEKYPYPKPYDYKNRRYSYLYELFDRTWDRFNENTKVIFVEGNVGVGKRDFAERLAKAFDLKYFGPAADDAYLINPVTKFDQRSLNMMLPEDLTPYDLTRFLTDKDPSRGHAGRLLDKWYREKFRHYCRALTHLLSTGQGVVCVRPPFSDYVFADALRKMGYITKEFYEYYNHMYINSIVELLKPHCVVYLDCPTDIARQRINERKNPLELNSKILGDDRFLKFIESSYQEKYLPKMKRSCEVVEIDYSEKADDLDLDAIVEEMQHLTLHSDDNDDYKFEDWRADHDDWTLYRKNYQRPRWFIQTFNMDPPWHCPEVYLSQEERDFISDWIQQHPAIKFDPECAPQLGYTNIRYKW